MEQALPNSIPSVRPATVADVPHIVEVNEQARSAGYSASGFVMLPLSPEGIRGEIDGEDVRYAVAETVDGVVGFVKYGARSLAGYRGIEWTTDPLDLSDGVHVEKLVVRAGHRGQGIGTALYVYLFRENHGRMLYTYVVASPCTNTASVAFHEHRGFSQRGLAPYESDDGSWFLERLYVMTDPSKLLDARPRSGTPEAALRCGDAHVRESD